MLDALITIKQSFRLQDLIDILIIAVMIYMLLVWVKNTASRFAFMGIMLLGVLYVGARLFHLYLTTMVLQAFFAILLIAIVVIFQEEIRRFLERIALLGAFRRDSADAAAPDLTERLIESVDDFCHRRVGALIVLCGREPIERHIKGGYQLRGEISPPLLASIFDNHSKGHDGAVIVDQGLAMRFGCHLPLCLDAAKCGSLGLRHTAAIGLSERCDALCIVVSEERGEVSVASHGELRSLNKPAELAEIIAGHYARLERSGLRQPVGTWARKNTTEKAVAIFLAAVLWFVFGSQREEIQREFRVPIEYHKVSSDWVIEEARDGVVRVTLAGSPQAFNVFEPRRLKISLDISEVKEGRQNFNLTSDMIKIPSNLELVKFEPRRVAITAYRLKSRQLRVKLVTKGKLPRGYRLKSIELIPRTNRWWPAPRRSTSAASVPRARSRSTCCCQPA
ncbi:MAG: DNA integrity scanning protein DisA [Deltaproteobacteria bacterium ADurb.Bin510]|nr:MAG: DNA integrity scanning protein DisA [Deltaproteobacteria bacterium ADurb.Bin510]